MDSPTLIIGLTVLFFVIGVSTSLVYYFARYYVKTDQNDKELLTKKPIELHKQKVGVDEPNKLASVGELHPAPIGEVATSDTPVREMPVRQPAKKNLSEALAKTRGQFWGRLKLLNWSSQTTLSSQLRDELEEILYTSDLGPQVAERLLSSLQAELAQNKTHNEDAIKALLRDEMLKILEQNQPKEDLFAKRTPPNPLVWMVLGVNGAGKTTTIGKLASQVKNMGQKVMIIAGDTFRAAADSQLKAWAERAGCEIFSSDNTKDPGAVAYAGLEKARALGSDLVIVDTAGRLHTQDHLMEELKKITRVMGKIDSTAPHERLLVIDANAGQNALEQARQFHAAVQLTGIVVTKMDGSSKAGVVFAIAQELKLPIRFVGVGESIEDLRPFDAKSFTEAIIC